MKPLAVRKINCKFRKPSVCYSPRRGITALGGNVKMLLLQHFNWAAKYTISREVPKTRSTKKIR